LSGGVGFDGLFLDEPIEVRPLEENFLPDPDVRQSPRLDQLEQRIPADAEGLEGFPKGQKLRGHWPKYIPIPPRKSRVFSLTRGLNRIIRDLIGITRPEDEHEETGRTERQAAPLLDGPALRPLSRAFRDHGIPGGRLALRNLRLPHVREPDRGHVLAGGARRVGAAISAPGSQSMKPRHLFAVFCRRCGRTFIFERPRRRLGWIPLPEGHGPARPCPGSFVFLHHRERREALRAGGRA